jgi:iron(III) transport system substrate-binding protein
MKRLVLAILLLLGAGGTVWLFRPLQAKGGLVLYAATGYAPDVAQAFTRRTGIAVTVISSSTGPLLARVSAEGHRPAWSLVWFDGDAAAAALDRAGLLARHTVPALDFAPFARPLIPADGAYTPTGVTLAGVFSIRSTPGRGAPGSTPADPNWNSLLSPAERGQFGMTNPQLSGPAYQFLASLLADHGGWPAGQAFVRALHANAMRILPTNPSAELALQTHQISLAMVQSSAAFKLALHDPAYRVVIPEPATLLPSVIAIAAHLPPAREAAAEAFVRFAMSPAIQKLRMDEGSSDSLYWPVTADAPAPPHLPPLSAITLATLDPVAWGAREAVIGTWFEGIMRP